MATSINNYSDKINLLDLEVRGKISFSDQIVLTDIPI